MRRTRLIVPAAGAGKRLGIGYPKTLLRVLGRPILDHILTALDVLAAEAVVVVSPTGEDPIRDFLKTRSYRMTVRTAIQAVPVGMADAVETGLASFQGDDEGVDYVIVWGDQITVRRVTVASCLEDHRKSGAALTFPTVKCPSPYTHVVRDGEKIVRGILESREGDLMPSVGESDCGVFIVQGELLSMGLKRLRATLLDPETGQYMRIGRRREGTGEFNFLPLITLWPCYYKVEALCIASEMERQGINTMDDVLKIASWLSERAERND